MAATASAAQDEQSKCASWRGATSGLVACGPGGGFLCWADRPFIFYSALFPSGQGASLPLLCPLLSGSGRGPGMRVCVCVFLQAFGGGG